MTIISRCVSRLIDARTAISPTVLTLICSVVPAPLLQLRRDHGAAVFRAPRSNGRCRTGAASRGLALGSICIWSPARSRTMSGKSAILDAVTVRHTRPVGQFLKGRMIEAGFDPYDDWRRLMERFDLTAPRQFYCYAGVSTDGTVRGRFATARHMFRRSDENTGDQLGNRRPRTVFHKSLRACV